MTTATSPCSVWRRSAVTLSLGALVAVGLSAPATGAASAAGPASTSVSSGAVATAAPMAGKRRNEPNPVTPGDFTGYGFDQCVTPTQSMMDRWLDTSPYLAVGIYISGDSRACRSQPNLTPQWVRVQLRKGWRLLPITLGPQASCQPRFPRYDDDFVISPKRGRGKYSQARRMGQNTAEGTITDATALGLTPGSTLWYDLEGFDIGNTDCRESALAFLSAYNKKIKAAGFVTGVYSSASSGIAMLDDARVERPNAFVLPDRIWLARWDGQANTSSSYVRSDGWQPRDRVKQYRGGHDEVWGGVRINIDTNYLDLGAGSVAEREEHCGGVTVSFPDYAPLRPKTADSKPPARMVKALQCLLSEKGLYSGKLHGVYSKGTIRAANAWKAKRGYGADDRWFRRDWISLLSAGLRPVQKVGTAGPYVRRVQRALNAANNGSRVRANGVFDTRTAKAVESYQASVGLSSSGVVDKATWNKLRGGKR